VSLLETEGLVKHYPAGGLTGRRRRVVRAVDGVSLTVAPGEALGLVGESGCGKSTLGRLAVGLEEPTAGCVRFQGREISSRSGNELRAARQHLQIIFQDPTASLDPRWPVGSLIAEPLLNYRVGTKAERARRVGELMELVGLEPLHAGSCPHELSGGQRQRVSIARALALNPSLIVCDEPVSSLDVSIRAQILNILRDLKESMGLAYLFISHDLAAVSYLSDRVAVMYLGKIVEVIQTGQLLKDARHPYTRALLAAVPGTSPGRGLPEAPLAGEPPDPRSPPSGCRFHPRCPVAAEACSSEEPTLAAAGAEHQVACHFGG
jgi:peptide/nickel transport system ATP-binding protein/oligopeptide transport system ATP-binding protein